MHWRFSSLVFILLVAVFTTGTRADDFIYILDRPSTGNPSEVYRLNIDGSGQTLIHQGVLSDSGMTSNSSHLYWSDVSGVMRADLDGTNVTSLGGRNALGMDATDSFIYMAYHTIHHSTDTVERYNLDLSGNTVLANVGDPRKIKVTDNFLYWTANPPGVFNDWVVRSDLDGSNITGLIGGFGDALGFDVTDSFIYYADNARQQIRRANLDGSGSTLFIDSMQARDIHVTDSFIYWSNSTTIRRANLDGSNIVVVASGFNLINDFEIVSSNVPEPSSLGLWSVVLAGLLIRRRRPQKRCL